jgi:hypothetical protein
VTDAYREAESGGQLMEGLSGKQCASILKHLIPQFRQITVVLDALDESENPRDLLKTLINLVPKSKGHVRFFFSSRQGVPVDQVFRHHYLINVQPRYTAKDIQSYIARELKDAEPRLLNRDKPDLQLEEEVQECLLFRASGM